MTQTANPGVVLHEASGSGARYAARHAPDRPHVSNTRLRAIPFSEDETGPPARELQSRIGNSEGDRIAVLEQIQN